LDNAQKLLGVSILVLCGYLFYSQKQKLETNEDPVPQIANPVPAAGLPAPKASKIPNTFDYEGTMSDEMGNSEHYKVRVKSDLHSASINGPFTPIQFLGNDNYQWVAGNITGIQFHLSPSVLTMYNFEGGIMGHLYRIQETEKDVITEPELKPATPIPNVNASVIDSTVSYQLPSPSSQSSKRTQDGTAGNDIQGTWTGIQPEYNLKNKEGEDMVLNGQKVRIPACKWEFVLRIGQSISAGQENLEDHKTAFYYGSPVDDMKYNNGVILIDCTISTPDKQSNVDITLRFTDSHHGLCMSKGLSNGPDFSIYKK
jgi:hypothetical protein